MTHSNNSSVRGIAANLDADKDGALTDEEMEVIRNFRAERQATAAAHAFLDEVRNLEARLGITITMTDAPSYKIQDPKIREKVVAQEHLAEVKRLNAEQSKAKEVAQALATLSGVAGMLYGTFLGSAAGREVGKAEGIEAALRAAGPLGRLLRARIAR